MLWPAHERGTIRRAPRFRDARNMECGLGEVVWWDEGVEGKDFSLCLMTGLGFSPCLQGGKRRLREAREAAAACLWEPVPPPWAPCSRGRFSGRRRRHRAIENAGEHCQEVGSASTKLRCIFKLGMVRREHAVPVGRADEMEVGQEGKVERLLPVSFHLIIRHSKSVP
jgi:hypothetical protein